MTVFDLLREKDNERFLAAVSKTLVYMAPIALFSEKKLLTKRKELENIDHTQIVFLMYTLSTTPTSYEDLFFGFVHHNNNPAEQCNANIKNLGGKHVKKLVKDLFDFAEHHEQATLALC